MTTKNRSRLQSRRPRGRPKTEDLEALEARLVLVAREAFVRDGYGATSINEIARSARVSKNTLYARFPSKAALFRAIVARQIAGVEEQLAPLSGGPGEPLENMLRTYLNVALRRSLEPDMRAINRLILAESSRFPELGDAAARRFKRGVGHMAGLIEECAARDGIPCRNPTSAAGLLQCTVYGWYIFVMINNRSVSSKERAGTVDGAIANLLANRHTW
jgi:TetR/AcrR family transcriptional regulator, mexJK operon transcriptional repressor